MVAVVEFKNRALGILDVSWVHRAGPNPLEIYGTEGFLSIDLGAGPRVWLESTRLEANGIKGAIAPSNLPPALPMPMSQWIAAIKDGTPMTIDLQDGWNLTQLLEGCYNRRPHRSGVPVLTARRAPLACSRAPQDPVAGPALLDPGPAPVVQAPPVDAVVAARQRDRAHGVGVHAVAGAAHAQARAAPAQDDAVAVAAHDHAPAVDGVGPAQPLAAADDEGPALPTGALRLGGRRGKED
jgi:hypothetical protein